MKSKIKIHEPLIILFVFLIALLTRFIRLGSTPFTFGEMDLSWQALQVARGESIELGSQIAYIGLTSLGFYLTQANAFMARFWPALIGSLFALVPLLWKEKLGLKVALPLALLLAIDPLQIASSRIINSPLIGMAGLVAGLSFLKIKKPALAGIALAIGLLGGLSFWLGLLPMLIALCLLKVVMQGEKLNNEENGLNSGGSTPQKPWWSIIPWFLGTILMIGSCFFLEPSGLGSTFGGLVSFFQRFSISSGVKTWQILLALLTYGFIPLVIGILAGIKAFLKKDRLGIFLLSWSVLSLLTMLIQPGRQVLDLIWAILPLWVLTARFVSSNFEFSVNGLGVRFAVMLFSIVILGFVLINIRSISETDFGQVGMINHLIAIAAGVILLIISILLVGFGWQFEYALSGLFFGLTIFTIITTLALSLPGIMGRSGNKAELWQTDAISSNGDVIVDIISEVSDRMVGEPFEVEVAVAGNGVLIHPWTLRDFRNINYYNNLPGNLMPGFILTNQDLSSKASSTYRGNEYLVVKQPSWDNFRLKEIVSWMITRNVTYDQRNVFLWVRTDLLISN
jgi:hypothetical protein